MAAGSQRVPVEGVAEAVVGVAANLGGVLAAGAIGDGPARPVVDLHLDGASLANPPPDQPDPALGRTLLRAFQVGPATAIISGRAPAGSLPTVIKHV